MNRFKVRYYEDAKVVETEIEADGFHLRSGSNGVTFYLESGVVKHEVHAFLDVVNVIKV